MMFAYVKRFVEWLNLKERFDEADFERVQKGFADLYT